ncbi:MAG: sugar phosphate isomerase/epimerase family protein [Armatimonadota bacterium]|jgi:sugar phosphate isomerase/epimerase|nr:sugar phosphate isomerase/epimerase [Acidobacteriota bacterium]
MKVGMLTSPFGREPLAEAVRFAADAGFDALEIATGRGSAHCDVTEGDAKAAQEVSRLVTDAGLEISSFACYANVFAEGPSINEGVVSAIRGAIDSASAIGVDVVCCLAGMSASGVSKEVMIKEWAPQVWLPLAEYAQSKGVKIAFENYFATLLQSTREFIWFFESCPHPCLGLNYDPSHLVHQGCDHHEPVELFADRVFHTHAKDTDINERTLRRIGNLNSGWWRYCIPGYGVIDWGQYIATLRENGVNNVLSIEHEDGALGREEGFLRGLAYLRQFA